MRGFITEQDFTAVEVEFPGIVSLYEHLATKPPTFLDLVRLYLSSDSPDVLSGSARPAFRPTA